MASEILAVPEQHLRDVITVIRVGLAEVGSGRRHGIKKEVREQLTKWCDEEEEYLDNCEKDE